MPTRCSPTPSACSPPASPPMTWSRHGGPPPPAPRRCPGRAMAARHGPGADRGRTAVDGLTVEGRVALVTGGAGGIGRAICADLAALGARVLVADLDERGAHETAAAL